MEDKKELSSFDLMQIFVDTIIMVSSFVVSFICVLKLIDYGWEIYYLTYVSNIGLLKYIGIIALWVVLLIGSVVGGENYYKVILKKEIEAMEKEIRSGKNIKKHIITNTLLFIFMIILGWSLCLYIKYV